MMKTFFILFTVVLPAICTRAGLCPFDCSCTTDDTCQYYCDGFVCKLPIPNGGSCSGHYSHPRECGTSSYCDTSLGFICQYQKSNGQYCTYDYSCISNNCDYSSRTCQFKSTVDVSWVIYVVPACVVFFLILIVCIVVTSVRRRRQQAIACYQNPYVVLPTNNQYSYQNSYIVGETAPPPYPGPVCAPSPKPYQG